MKTAQRDVDYEIVMEVKEMGKGKGSILVINY